MNEQALMLIQCDPADRFAVEFGLLRQDMYEAGVDDGLEGKPPTDRGCLEYLQGYVDGCRQALASFQHLVEQFRAETEWVDEF